jgi:hypothetical protein
MLWNRHPARLLFASVTGHHIRPSQFLADGTASRNKGSVGAFQFDATGYRRGEPREQLMSQDKAILREFVERIEGVAQTHYELEIEGSNRKKTLVVQVEFDLDPNSSDYSRAKIDAVEDAFATIIREENSDVVSKLRILGRPQQAATTDTDSAAGRGASSRGGAATGKGAPVNFQSPSN